MIQMTATKIRYTAFQRQIAREGLAEHAQCCTPEAPCQIAEGLRKIADSTGLAQDVHPDAERRMPRGNPQRMSSRPADGPRLATDPQMRYIHSLMSEIVNGADARTRAGWEIANHAITTETEKFGGLTMKRVDPILTMLKEAVAEQRAAVGATRPTASRPTPSRPAAERVTEGMYEMDGNVYRVKLSGAGRLYAMLLVITNGTGSFEYAPGIINRLRSEHRMTLERASQLSVQYHFCVRCAKELTRESSIARGLGPVCAESF
jgi:hypothetical protein